MSSNPSPSPTVYVLSLLIAVNAAWLVGWLTYLSQHNLPQAGLAALFASATTLLSIYRFLTD